MKKVISAKQKHPDYSNEKLINMFTLAKNAPKTLPEFKDTIKSKNTEDNKLDTEDIENLFDILKDFF